MSGSGQGLFISGHFRATRMPVLRLIRLNTVGVIFAAGGPKRVAHPPGSDLKFRHMAQTGTILIIDDDWDVLRAAQLLLKRHFKKVDGERNPQQIPYLLNNNAYDVILLDMNFTRDRSSGKEGFLWLDRILDINPKASVILFTAYGDVEMAVRAIKAGAADFVLKPWENEKLLATVQAAMKDAEAEPDREEPAPDNGSQSPVPIIGESPLMRQLLETAENVAGTDANVLILGENGTGKDLLAGYIHQSSARREKPFVSVDMGAIPETLFESELFGHLKGAFTDARADRKGRFEEADQGTVFLDEISNLSLHAQAKLLNVLQSRVVVPVGSNKPKPLDVRLICASNRDLEGMVESGSFRQDLLYRINTIEMQLPPLRERGGDIILLARHFLEKYRNKYKREVRDLSDSLINQLSQYPWPGNIRELQHAIERAVILAQSDLLQPGHVFKRNNSYSHGTGTGFNLEETERELIRKALREFNGSITQAAQELGLSRAALYRRLEKYGI